MQYIDGAWTPSLFLSSADSFLALRWSYVSHTTSRRSLPRTTASKGYIDTARSETGVELASTIFLQLSVGRFTPKPVSQGNSWLLVDKLPACFPRQSFLLCNANTRTHPANGDMIVEPRQPWITNIRAGGINWASSPASTSQYASTSSVSSCF